MGRIWCILRDCASVLVSRTGKPAFGDLNSLERQALVVSRDELCRVVTLCTNVTFEVAGLALDFLTCNLEDITGLFIKGLWANPLVKLQSGSDLAILAAPIFVG